MLPGNESGGPSTPDGGGTRRLRRGKERQLRNWREPMPEGVNKQLDQAANYFSNMVRVPAALIAGQASNMLFKLTDLPTAQRSGGLDGCGPQTSVRSRLYVTLWRIHLLLMGYTVCSQLTAVLLCFIAHAQILDISREELTLEPTAIHLINRHVEFEYCMVHAAFFSGLAVFLIAIATRVVAFLAASPRGSTLTGRREVVLSAGLATMLASTLCWWVCILTEDLPMANVYVDLEKLLRRIYWLLRFRMKESPFAFLSVLLGFVSVCFSFAALLTSSRSPPAGTNGAAEEAEEG